jgi:hypothetical protein
MGIEMTSITDVRPVSITDVRPVVSQTNADIIPKLTDVNRLSFAAITESLLGTPPMTFHEFIKIRKKKCCLLKSKGKKKAPIIVTSSSNHFRIGVWNAQNVETKIELTLQYILENHIDIYIIVESWIQKMIKSKSYYLRVTGFIRSLALVVEQEGVYSVFLSPL